AAGNQTLESGLKGVEDGSLDYVMLGRGLLADPYFPKKAFEGKDEDIRPCIRCNEFCFARAFAQHPLTCAVNTRAGNEKVLAIKKSEQPKKVAIVGGGVSGLEAARVAALKGHSVTVYEKSNQLGGQVIAAAAPPFKKQLKRFLEYLIRQVKQLGVAIVYNKAITANSPELKNADEILVAIGASSIKPGIPGMDNGKVIDVIDAHTTRHGEIGSTVVIAGGGLSGCDCAIELAMESKQVTIVEMLSRVAMKSNLANQPCINKVLAEKKVTVLTDSKVLSFGDEGVTIENKEGKKQVLAADTIITAFGTKANSELADEIFLNNQKVKVIGDCCTVGLVGTAVRDGFMAAWAID
ncbi:MAG: FAD-dependent oxidoreductase, partial [Clostridiales bacterium]|nr:FAD-dependent oxidoreductase [Clostridiales bacterium]